MHVGRTRSFGSFQDTRLRVFWYAGAVSVCFLIVRLFFIQVLGHEWYRALASGQHQAFRELVPERGEIFVHDLKDSTLVSIASNQQLAFVYAEPRHVQDPVVTAQKIGELLDYTEEQIDALAERLDQPEDPYEPIERRVPEQTLQKILVLDLPGIHFTREAARLYPEPGQSGHVMGFVGSDAQGNLAGRYGIEGYFNELLAGTKGYLQSEKDIAGRLIAVGSRMIEPAVDGADLVLTLDRTIQYVACRALKQTVATHQADGGSVVILEPSSGRILALCGEPDFDPNAYARVQDVDTFNNPALFAAYEPGSVLKTMTVAGAVDAGAITPSTTYEDMGGVQIGGHEIKNSDLKAHGVKTMTQALEESLNTGMIFAMRQMGQQKFVQYMKDFGFGQKTGIELDTEVSGDLRSLEKSGEIYAATASFGQGVTVTPIQLAAAYGAIANGGMLKKPFIVDEIRHSDGRVEKTWPQNVRRVLEEKTARLVGAMLVSVIEHGHGKRGGVEGYYIGGKTGTAQVARTDAVGYDPNVTIGSFAGFGPVEDPKFAMVVRIDHPRTVPWAESTAAPLFGEIASFLLQYFEVSPTRK